MYVSANIVILQVLHPLLSHLPLFSLSHALQSTVHIFPHERVNAGIFMNTVR